MDCEQALLLISARIDRALGADDNDRLEAHLADCPACRATAEAFALQDGDLRETFAPRRAAAAVMADRVGTLLPVAPPPPETPPRRQRFVSAILSPLAAAACLALVFWLTARPSSRPPAVPGEDVEPRTA